MTYEREIEQHPIDQANKTINELKKGKVPPTGDIARTMENAASEIQPNTRDVKLSSQGQEVLQKTEDALRSTAKFAKHVSPDDELQQLIYHSKKSASLFKMRVNDKAGEVKDEHRVTYDHLQQDAQEAMDDLVTVLKLFIQSHNFRRLVGDFGLTVSEFTKYFANKANEKAQSAATNLKQDSLDTRQQGLSNQHLQQQTSIPSEKQQLKFETTGQWDDNLHQKDLSTYTAPSAPWPQPGQQPGDSTIVQWPGQGQDLGDKLEHGKQKVSEKWQQGKREIQENTEIDLGEVEDRLKQTLLSIMDNPNYQDAVHRLFRIANRSYEVLQDSVDKAKEVSKEETPQVKWGKIHLQKAKYAAQKLLENLGEGYSLDRLIEKLQDCYEEISKDQKLRQMFEHFKKLVSCSLTDKEYLESDKFKDDYERLKEMNSEFDDKWYSSFDDLTNEWNNFMDSISSDQVLKETSAKWSDLLATTVLDSSGRPTLKPELLFDLAQIAKLISEKIQSIPVQRFTGSDENGDYVLDNLYIDCDNLAPSHIHFNFSATMDTEEEQQNRSHAKLELTKMQTGAKNVKFWYHRKTVPKISDEGTFDIEIPKDGLELYINLTPSTDVDNHVFTEVEVKCTINNLNLHIEESKHQALYTIFYPFIKGYVRENIEKALEDRLKEAFLDLDEQVVKMVQYSRRSYNKSSLSGYAAGNADWRVSDRV